MDRSSKGILVVVSGFSGSGKGTIMEQLILKYPEDYALSVSATTRNPRKGEIEGKSYFFKTRVEFESMIDEGLMIEFAEYVNNYYGTPKDYVNQQLEQGKDVILEIEIQGALKVKEKYPDALLLFITPPNALELKERLVKRGTEDEQVIHSRLLRAYEEAKGIEHYDYFVINDDLVQCVEEVNTIIKNEHLRVSRNCDMIKTMLQELNSFSKGD